MAGLFDNFGANVAGGLSGFGGVLGGIGRGLAGAQNYNTMSQAFGDPRAALMAQTNPQGFQTLIFMQQLREMQQKNPGMDINEALYRLSAGGQKEQYGNPQIVPGFRDASGAEAPGTIAPGSRALVGPPGFGFEGNQSPVAQTTAPPTSPAGTAQPQASPGIGGSPSPALSPMMQRGITYNAQKAAAEETAKKQSDSLQQYPNALVTAQDAVKRLEAFRDNPNLPSIVGGPLGLKGRTAAMGQGQADLVNEANELQGKIIGNTLNATRSVSGRPVTPGALKDLTVGAGDLIAGRKGTVPGYINTINNSIDLIKKETQAAWEATGKKGAVPVWGSSAPSAPSQYPEGTVAVNKQTGERRVLRAGQWTAHP